MAGTTVKLGVDVTQFKSGMKQAQQSAKTLQAQIKANEAQFKATGDKEKYMTEQSKLLKAQLDAQKTAAKNAEQALKTMRDNGVSETSSAYQQLATQMANAQAAMYSTQAALNSLTTSEQQASAGASGMAASLNNISKQVSFDNLVKGIDKVADAAVNAAKKAVEMGKELWSVITDTAARADDYATMAEVMGISIEEVQRMDRVAAAFEAPLTMMKDAYHRVRLSMTNDSESVKEAYEALGVSPFEVIGYTKYGEEIRQAKDFRDVFWDIGEALMNVDDEAKQDRLATTLLGKNWAEMAPLFGKGREAYESAMAVVTVATDEAVQNAAALNDAITNLENSFETFKMEVLGGIAPQIQTVVDALSGLMDSITEYLKTPEGKELLNGLATAISNLFDSIANIDPEQAVQTFAGVFEKITDAFKWINNNWEGLKAALVAIGGTLATWKVASGVLTALQALKGLKNNPLGGTGTGTGTGTGIGTGGGNLLNGQTVTSQNVTTQSITNATITSATLTSLTIPAENVTTSNVTTMYVQTMIGGNGTNPGTGGNGGNGIGGGNGTGFNMLMPPGTGGTGNNLYNGYGNGLQTGNGYNLNNGYGNGLPAGNNASQPAGNEPIRIDPDAYNNVSDTPVQSPQTQPQTQPDQGNSGGLNMQWLWGMVPLGVLALGTAPAIIKDYKLAELYKGRYEETKQFAESAAAAGANAEDIRMLMRLARTATGMKEDPNSSTGYKMSYMNYSYDISETDENDWILQALGDPMIRGLLYSDIQKYGPRDAFGDLNTGIGWSPWQLLLRYWGNYTETDWDKNGNPYERRTDNPLDAQEINALLEYLRQMYINKIQAQIDKNEAEKALNIEVEPELAEGFQEQLQGMLNAMTLTVSVFPAIGRAGISGGVGGILGAMLGGGSHANGIWSVPWDGYPAILHKNERVIPANQTQQYNSNIYFGNVNLNNGLEIEALTESIERRNRRQMSGYGA